ncbi:hypothetical protein D3C76_1470860 [compost metagenome]
MYVPLLIAASSPLSSTSPTLLPVKLKFGIPLLSCLTASLSIVVFPHPGGEIINVLENTPLCMILCINLSAQPYICLAILIFMLFIFFIFFIFESCNTTSPDMPTLCPPEIVTKPLFISFCIA